MTAGKPRPRRIQRYLIDYESAPPIGTIVIAENGRRFQLVQVRPHKRRSDGGDGYVLTWQEPSAPGVLYTSGLRSRWPALQKYRKD